MSDRAAKQAAELVDTRATPIESESVGTLVTALESELADRLREVGSVGRGGMARVDLVHDQALDRRVVMKRLHDHLEGDAGTLAMFVREARITGQLEHPNIVPVHDIGLAGRSVYFTMKRVEGRTLGEVIAGLKPGPLTHDTLLDLLDLVLKVADALAFAHSKGFLHLDIKPGNVMVGDFGQVYLMDWGVARSVGTPPELAARGGEAPNAEASGAVLVGTATHMAPEQARGITSALDQRTDVYAMGALLYHLLARTPPFDADSYWVALVRAQMGELKPLETAAPWVPEALVRIVKRAMAFAPGDRYQTVVELRQDLVAFTRGGGLFDVVHFEPGAYVVREGEPGDCAYIIERGTLEVIKGEGAERRLLRTMGAGEVFGETAILSPGNRTASVVAKEPAVLRRVTSETLDREVASLKPWMGVIVRTLAARFRESEERDSKSRSGE
ncbi:MAG: cyclic nucleotide-binding domain-containing protein [Sandaracinaceae bacterium]|nr:cyclic nucleotide-binding domain-containing protein [Sandaracinaceae bacterium]